MILGPLHHLGLTITDADASADWYSRVLGFERVGEYESPDGAYRKVFLVRDGLDIRLGLSEFRGPAHDAFDERRVGLDHVAFSVKGEAELEQWADHLREAGVAHSPVAPSHTIPGAFVLVFRDPDNIQLEIFADPR